MRITTFTCLLAALHSACFVLANAIHEPAETPAPEPKLVEDKSNLELRQGAPVVDPAATLAPIQVSPVTEYAVNSPLPGGGATYITLPYTQTFAAVPDQWYTSGAGQIGYGTLQQKMKREAAPTVNTGIAGRIRRSDCGATARAGDGDGDDHEGAAACYGGVGRGDGDDQQPECNGIASEPHALGVASRSGGSPITTFCASIIAVLSALLVAQHVQT